MCFKIATDIRERIDPSKLPGVTWRLASSIVNEGVIFWNTGHESDAEERFCRAEVLLLSIPTERRNVGGQFDLLLAQVYLNWCGMLQLSKRCEEAVKRTDTGLSWIEPYLENEPNDRSVRYACLSLHGNRAYALKQLGRHRESAIGWTRVVELCDKPVPQQYRVKFAVELIDAGDLARALDQALRRKTTADVAPEDCYDLGRIFARSAATAGKHTNLPADERTKQVKYYTDEVMHG